MFIKKMGIVLIVVMAMILTFTACSQENKGEDSLDRVIDSGKFTVVGSGGYRPFNFMQDGEVAGFDVDTGAAISERLGVDLNYVTSDWDGLIEGLRSKRYDGILGSMAITDDRKEQVNFTIPYYYSGAQLVVRKDSGITDPNDMEGKMIAVATGTNFVGDVEALGAQASLYQDDNATIMEVIEGRVDGAITDRLVAIEAMNKISGGDQLMLCGQILRLEEMAIAVNKEDNELLAELNYILLDLHKDGTLKKISEEWLNGENVTDK